MPQEVCGENLAPSRQAAKKKSLRSSRLRASYPTKTWRLSGFAREPNFPYPHRVADVTRILQSIEHGDPKAAAALLPLVYDELRRLANYRMANEGPGQTLQPTALVHEAWLKLAGEDRQQWNNRRHFFGAAAEAMRRILVDRARRKQRVRHGGELERVDLADVDLPIGQNDDKCLRVHESLDALAAEDPEKAEVVKLKIFAGMKVSEIAVAMDCSEKTIQRHWNYAKAWLSDALR